MRDVIYVKLDIAYPIKQQLNATILRKSYFILFIHLFIYLFIFFFYFFGKKKLKWKVIISLCETMKLSVSISPMKSILFIESINE